MGDCPDALPVDGSFDAAQSALHGLLAAYHENDPSHVARCIARLREHVARSAERAPARGLDSIASADVPVVLAPERGASAELWFLSQWRRWVARAMGLAAAIILAWWFWSPAGLHTRPAGASPSVVELQSAARVAVLMPSVLDPLLDDDPSARASREAEIKTLAAERDGLLWAAAAATDGPEQARLERSAYSPWCQMYRRMRDLGRWDDARREIRTAIDRSRGRLEVWHFVCLYDLAETEWLAGRLDLARESLVESLEFRQADAQQWRPVDAPAGYTGHFAFSVAPVFWKLAGLAIARNELAEARHWITLSRQAFADRLNYCAQHLGLPALPDAAPLELLRRLPKDVIDVTQYADDKSRAKLDERFHGQAPDPQWQLHLRQHLYHEACLLRSEGRFADALTLLDHSRAIDIDPAHDDERLLFWEPLESARLEILCGRANTALDYVRRAEENAGEVRVPSNPGLSKRPIGPMPRAELDLLHGIALRMAEREPELAARLVTRALAVPRMLAERLPPEQRATMLRQFTPWQVLGPARVPGDPAVL